MKESDFPQFDDPRVREVFAAAANLVETVVYELPATRVAGDTYDKMITLRAALFAAQHSPPKCTCGAPENHFPDCKQLRAQHSAPHKTRTVRVEPPCGPCLLVDDVDAAQHSKPKCDCYDDGVGSVLGPSCQVHRTHEHPVEFDKWGFGKPVTNRFNVDGSKPGGKAFIAAIEKNDEGQVCPDCKVVHTDSGWGHVR